MRKLYFICSLFILFINNAAAQQEILWLTDDRTDAKIKYFVNPIPSSTAEDTVGLLMRALPAYNLKLEFAQGPRITRLLKKLPNVCAPNKIKTPQRLQDALFSLPINLFLNLHLYYKKHHDFQHPPTEALDKNNHLISLEKLFSANHEHYLGIDKGRSFGLHLDKQIKNIDSHNLVIRSGGKRSLSLIQMLAKNRIDYLIDYPTTIKEGLVSLSEKVELESVEISGSPDYIIGYVACSKGPLGEAVIADINSALRKLHQTDEFYQAHARYIDDTDLSSFNRAYKQVFQKNSATNSATK